MKLRLLGLIAALIAGLAAGLAYGWLAAPARYANTTPGALRMDYKADYVLMVAEAYQVEKDASLAARRLEALESGTPAQVAQQAVVWAQQKGYAQEDLRRMADLAVGLQNRAQGSSGGQP